MYAFCVLLHIPRMLSQCGMKLMPVTLGDKNNQQATSDKQQALVDGHGQKNAQS
jgi:hypothetical protein